MKKLKGKVAVITGAGRGIGRILAEGFAKEGASLVLIARTLSELKETAKQAGKQQKDILLIKADISKEKEVVRVSRKIGRKYGAINILINNAGVLGPLGMITDSKTEDWMEPLKINLLGTYLCTKYLLPLMFKSGEGKIINLSGAGAAYPKPWFSAYAASKAAVIRLSENLAEELKKYNIQVNALAPGGVSTRMQERIMNSEIVPKDTIREAKEILSGGGTPPSRIIDLAIFLATEKSARLTGKFIHVNDPWRDWSRSDIDEINRSDLYTLRRINPK